MIGRPNSCLHALEENSLDDSLRLMPSWITVADPVCPSIPKCKAGPLSAGLFFEAAMVLLRPHRSADTIAS